MDDVLKNWMDGYLRAWESNDPDDIRTIFTDDAVYAFSPSDPEPLRGIDAIVAGWLDSKDDPGTWSFTWEPVARTDEVAIVQGETKYEQDNERGDYDNLWVIRLTPDGRAREFTEWYMERK